MNEILVLEELNQKIKRCKRCPRLAIYIRQIAKDKTKRFRDENYWGKPLSGFGDFKAELLIIGLAPVAYGGNHTGRMFTGDSSGDWLAKVLYENGFATTAKSKKLDDDFNLKNAYITAAVRCTPPQNKPLKEELDNCSDYLIEEMKILKNVKVLMCLGRIAFDSCCKLLGIRGQLFSHDRSFSHKGYFVICSYHPSRQNTQTGRLSWKQWNDVFTKARAIVNYHLTCQMASTYCRG